MLEPEESVTVELASESGPAGNLRHFFRTLVAIAVLCVGGVVAAKMADKNIPAAFFLMVGALFTVWMVAP